MHRVLITRAPHQASPLAEALRAMGCEALLIPTIDLAPPASFNELDEAIANLDTFQGLIFTSANAVEAFARRATKEGATPFDFQMWVKQHRSLIAAIGPATAQALAAIGLRADLVPPQAVAESLTASLLPHSLQPDETPTRFLLVRAESARDYLPHALRAAGAHLTIAPAYRTIVPESSVAKIRHLFRDSTLHPDAITFTSSATVTNLLALLEAANLELPPKIMRASIGPVTTQTLRDAGLPPHIEAPEATVVSLAQAIALHLQNR